MAGVPSVQAGVPSVQAELAMTGVPSVQAEQMGGGALDVEAHRTEVDRLLRCVAQLRLRGHVAVPMFARRLQLSGLH